MNLSEQQIIELASDCDISTGDQILDGLFVTYNESSPRDDIPYYYRFLYKLGRTLINSTLVELGCKYGAGSLHFLAGGGHKALAVDATDHIKCDLFDEYNFEFKQCSSTSSEALNKIDSTDVVFIDTDHQYETTKNEFELWLPKVVNGGLILFDDVGAEEYGCTKFWNELQGRKIDLHHLHPVGWGFGIYIKD